MAKSKKGKNKPSVKVNDLQTAKDPTGGAKVAVEYKPQKADGSLDAGIHFKYDLKAQKEA